MVQGSRPGESMSWNKLYHVVLCNKTGVSVERRRRRKKKALKYIFWICQCTIYIYYHSIHQYLDPWSLCELKRLMMKWNNNHSRQHSDERETPSSTTWSEKCCLNMMIQMEIKSSWCMIIYVYQQARQTPFMFDLKKHGTTERNVLLRSLLCRGPWLLFSPNAKKRHA